MLQTFVSKAFAKSLNIQKQSEKNIWEKSNDGYLLSIRVQTTINHLSIFTFLCFLRQYQRQRKCFLSERELKRALRDKLARAAWLGPSNFLLVCSATSPLSCACKLFWTLLLSAQVQSLYGAERKESSGTGLYQLVVKTGFDPRPNCSLMLPPDSKVYFSFDRSSTTGFKFDSLHASLLTVLRVVYAIFRLSSGRVDWESNFNF